MTDITERFVDLVVEHSGLPKEKVTLEAIFIDDLGLDSLDTIELVMAAEEEFGIEIPDDQAVRLLTVKDAVVFIKLNIPV